MAKQTRSFQYQRRSAEDVKERANAKGGNFDSFVKPKYKVYKVKDGKNTVRIMPPTWEKPRHYGYDLWVNYGIGVDNASYLSLSKMLGEPDPLAEARRLADKDGDEDTAKALNPRQRIAMWVIDRDAESEGPQLFLAPFTLDKDLASISVDEDTNEVVLVDDPEEGCDFRFYREGKGLNTKYPAAKMRLQKPSPLSDDQDLQQDWLDYIQDNPIPETLHFYDYKHIAEAFGGAVRTDKKDADERPSRRQASNDDDDPPPRRRPTNRSEAADDDSPWRGRQSGRNDDHEEEPTPTRRAQASKPARDEELEDEPEPSPRRNQNSTGNSRRVAAREEQGGEDDAPPPRRGARQAAYEDPEDDGEEAPPAPPPRAGGIRERLAQRRSNLASKGDD